MFLFPNERQKNSDITSYMKIYTGISTSYLALLKACSKRKDVNAGSKLHAEITTKGIHGSNPYVGEALVNMYAKCGALSKARQVFAELPIRVEETWTALIAGYAHHGFGKEALNCYERMLSEGLAPSSITLRHVLKACGSTGSIDMGAAIHGEIVNKGFLQNDVVLGNALMDMYAKCGRLAWAEQVFVDLPIRDVVSWNVLITGYINQGRAEEAINHFNEMRDSGQLPDAVTFICVLKACGSRRDVEKGKEVHDDIVAMALLANDIVLGNTLVDMYAKCGALYQAWQVLSDLPLRDVVSWTTLITGCANQGQADDAIDCLRRMQGECHLPNNITYISAVKACTTVERGKRIHSMILSQGLLGKDPVLGNALVSMYAKHGDFPDAEEMLGKLSVRDSGSWNTLIIEYSQKGFHKEALDCFKRMQNEGTRPDAVTFTCTLVACGNIKEVDIVNQIHDEIMSNALLTKDVMLGTTLVNAYVKCGKLVQAEQVLNKLPGQDAGSWNALIVGYAEYGQGEEALNCFARMWSEGINPDPITFICLLKACGLVRSVEKGRYIHELIIGKGFFGIDNALDNALVDMYAKCGNIAKAEQVFYELPTRDVVSWNALISGYANEGLEGKALDCYREMQSKGVTPNAITIACILKACASVGSIGKGKQVHEDILKTDLLMKDTMVCNALVDMYAKCGALAEAEEVLNELHVQGTVAWNALISGYVQQGQDEGALACFDRMQCGGLSPSMVTFICIVKACGCTGAMERGEQIHEQIVKKGFLANNPVLSNALVDMYAKCGNMMKAEKVLYEIPFNDVVPWNSLITGYALQGHCKEAMNCFLRMQNCSISPDAVSFVCLLNAFSHSGLVDEGEKYFMDMYRNYGMAPCPDHYACIIDNFGRAGHLEKALLIIKYMPFEYTLVWIVLMSACRKWENVTLGRFAFDQAIERDSNNKAAYVLMTNIYAAAGMYENAAMVEAMRI